MLGLHMTPKGGAVINKDSVLFRTVQSFPAHPVIVSIHIDTAINMKYSLARHTITASFFISCDPRGFLEEMVDISSQSRFVEGFRSAIVIVIENFRDMHVAVHAIVVKFIRNFKRYSC